MLAFVLASLCFAAPLVPQHPEPSTTPALVHAVRGAVTGVDAASKKPVRVTLWLHDYRREAATIVADVRAAADGTFEFAAVPWLAAHDWGFAFFTVIARQGDLVAAVLLRGEGAAQDSVPVALRPAVTLRGRVTAQNGEPVAGAAVRLQGMVDGDRYLFFAETPPFWTASTATDGSFAIAGVPAGWKYSVTCKAEKFATGRIDQADDAPFDLELGPGAVLTGRVTLANGEPAVRARVCAQGIKAHAWCTARTDDHGVYRLVGLPDDAYNVWTDIEDLTCVALDSQPVALGEETRAPDLVAIAGGFFVGRVLDAATGKPVQPGATADVAIYGPSRPRSGAGCDISPVRPDGTFRIRVAPGSNYIYLRAGAGFAEVDPANFTIDVAEGAEQVVEFRVRPGGRELRPK
ncbi:MAG TPA: carboxypeptidase regulatory-like domain-containing protein [Planctomycetota bacterium]|nr:carboxypeptidase regulatory-like domain-containing protein [Planctomycetota bacterium]